jgi:hypothetical protein
MKALTGWVRVTMAGSFSRAIGKAITAAWNTITDGIATMTAIFIMTIATTIIAKS